MPDSRETMQRIIEESGYPELKEKFGTLNDEVRAILLSNLTEEVSEDQKQSIMNRVKSMVDDVESSLRNWLVTFVALSYLEGVNETRRRLDKSEADIMTLQQDEEFSDHREATNNLVADAFADYAGALDNVVRNTETMLNESLMDKLERQMSEGMDAGLTNREIAENVVSELEDRGFTALVDRGGNRWSLQNYSDMLTRTHVIRTNTQGVINTMFEFNYQLVEYSAHGANDIICGTKEGEIFSITGESDEYPHLENLTPSHPNCKHSLYPRPDLEA